MTARERAKATQAASRGASLLDQYVPGWHKKIDASMLQKENPAACILGQAVGDFFDGVHEVAENALLAAFRGTGIKLDLGDCNVAIDASYYGFDAGGLTEEAFDEAYSFLAETWKTEIDARLLKETAKRRRAAKKAVATRRANARKQGR
jgi:hypothetical protein